MVKLVAHDAGARRSPRQDGKGGRVRNQPDLADRLHSVNVNQLLKQADRHLGAGQADAFDELVCELRDMNGFGSCDAADIAILETDQLHAGLSRGGQHLTVVHSLSFRARVAPEHLAVAHFLLLPTDDAYLYYLF